MDSQRQKKFSRLIQKELGEIFQQDAKSHFHGAFITVTHTVVSPDMSVAKVYLSLMLVKDKEAFMQTIRTLTKTIRSLLADRIRKQVRIIPELVFYLDDSAEYAEKIDKVISSLHIPPAPTEKDSE
ncbi:MAG: 30S ribosome-binding factor RbfA [Cytophagales bacterium]|nr:30S ribosome-binding factor RbfA [Cytophagales bacterium]